VNGKHQEAETMKALVAPFILVAALFVALTTSFAQNAPGVLRWAEGAPNATSEVKNDMTIDGLKTDDTSVWVSIGDLKETEYNRVWIQVSNHGKAPIDFNPQAAVLLKGDKGIKAEVPDKAANSIQRFGEAKSQELASAKCPNMIATACQPNNAQLQMSKQVSAFSSQQAVWVRENGVKPATLAPGGEAKGWILFKKDKKSADYVLRIAVGNQVFEFPLKAENKAPSYD
jgi:hypothetical protein